MDCMDRTGPTDRTIGYVLKVFPRLSETFIVNEVVARERAGERIEIAALRPPNDGRFHAKLAALEATVEWIPQVVRTADRLWALLARGRDELPGFDAALPELLRAGAGDAAQAIAVARWARERGVDHLHAHFATAATTVARLASLLTGLPYSFTAHAKDIFHCDVDEAALGRAIDHADHVVTVSDFNVADLRRRFPAARTPIVRVHNGVDLDEMTFAPRAEAPGAATGPPVPPVLAVGRLVEKKGFADLVDALSILAGRGRPVGARLVGTGPLAEALEAQVAACGLTSSVELAGAQTQTEVHRAMRAASVFVVPCVTAADGDRDGLPTVVLEAMALGTPVVATSVTGMPEAVLDGTTGRLVPERDPYALADAIAALLDDDVTRRRMALAARSHVERCFDVRAQAAALADLVRRRPRLEAVAR